jgi:hypothetical protein
MKKLRERIKHLLPLLQASVSLIAVCNGLIQLNQNLDITDKVRLFIEHRLNPPAIEQLEPKTQEKIDIQGGRCSDN